MENVSSAQLSKKMDPEEYDLVILGGGTGSTIAAWTFAKQGQRVAAIDRKYVGGSCPNIACLPSKNVIHSAKVASYFRRSDEFGIARKDFTVNMSAVRDRKRRMVSGWNNVYLDNYKKSGAEFILGSGPLHWPQDIGSHAA
jgi:pyruvate/2-oxoglutarate dehydrogenase complex dihydrolipoamide dehydrogenase (E3) component